MLRIIKYPLIFLLCASEEDATVVYQNAFQLGITRRGYVWLVTEQSFTGTARNELPQGERNPCLL